MGNCAASVKDSLGGIIPSKYDSRMQRAAEAGDRDEVYRSLGKGADINARDPETQETALHKAVRKGNVEVVKLLLSNSAAVDATDCEFATPLHIAAAGGHSDIARLLLDNHCLVDPHEKDGNTPLQFAVAYDHLEMSNILIRAGADVADKDNAGNVPMDKAVSEAMRDLLRETAAFPQGVPPSRALGANSGYGTGSAPIIGKGIIEVPVGVRPTGGAPVTETV